MLFRDLKVDVKGLGGCLFLLFLMVVFLAFGTWVVEGVWYGLGLMFPWFSLHPLPWFLALLIAVIL